MQTTLYKKSKQGKIQQWTIELNGSNFRTIEGFVDGALSTSAWTSCQGKRIGMSNETTPSQQAAKEVEAKIKKQRDKGWADNVELIDAAKPKIAPMLAHKWEDHNKTILYDLEDESDAFYSQPKLDGIRCNVTIDGIFSRNGKPIFAAPHIFEAVSKVIKQLDLINVIADGELYNHNLKADFNEIVSIVRKQKPTSADIAKSEEVLQYHIYDIQVLNHPKMSFQERHYLLRRFFPGKLLPLVIVKTDLIEDKNQMDELYGQYLEQGYEGQMIRRGSSIYQNSRTKDLLKRKEFQDAEFTIVDIEEGKGNRSGMMGRIKFEGFDANARGSHEFFKELLKNKHKYIGQKATVRYQNLTPDGKPRFPVVVAIRDYE